MEENFPILTPKNKRKRPPLDSTGKTWIPLPSAWDEPVNLPWKIEDWEKETLPHNIVCPQCGTVVINVLQITL